MIEYEDFDLRISADGLDYWVSAQRGVQAARERLTLDPPSSWDLWNPRERGTSEVEELGARLFSTLIRDSVRTLYDQACGQVKGNPTKGVRIRIRLEPRESRLRPLLRIPWEILFDPFEGTGNHLALNPRMPVVRTLESAAEILPSSKGHPLKILTALSEPRLPTVLDLESERQSVEDALEFSGAQIENLQPVTREKFQRRIRDGQFHIVHYLGHGDFAEQDEEGTLLLEGPNRSPDPLRASTFASFFKGRPMPRLVVLSACHTAVSGYNSATSPYAGIAAALVGEGLPAVLAMQTAVRDRSAIRFTERLYERIAAGDSIEEAVIEGRKELAVAWPTALDWAVPVLFVRESPDLLIPNDPQLQRGIEQFLKGNYREATMILEKLREPEDRVQKALLFRQLSRIAAMPNIPIDKFQEIDQDLQHCLSSIDSEVVAIAKLALGIHRFDRMEPRHFRTQGLPSALLFNELGSSRRSPLEVKISHALGASRDAQIRFNLL